MKKRIVLGLVLLASLSMLISSFAHATELPADLQTSISAELMKQNDKALIDTRALLQETKDEEARDVIQARIWDLQQEQDQLKSQLD